MFREDLIHCSLVYQRINYRLHCYVTIPGIAFMPDVVAGVNEKVFQGEFCGHLDVDSQAARQHRFYCQSNPRLQTASVVVFAIALVVPRKLLESF